LIILFTINLVKFELVWPAHIRNYILFMDGGSIWEGMHIRVPYSAAQYFWITSSLITLHVHVITRACPYRSPVLLILIIYSSLNDDFNSWNLTMQARQMLITIRSSSDSVWVFASEMVAGVSRTRHDRYLYLDPARENYRWLAQSRMGTWRTCMPGRQNIQTKISSSILVWLFVPKGL